MIPALDLIFGCDMAYMLFTEPEMFSGSREAGTDRMESCSPG